jgi:hypothetical protein
MKAPLFRALAGLLLAHAVQAQAVHDRPAFPGGGGTSTVGPATLSGTLGRHDGRSFNAVITRTVPTVVWAHPADLPHGTPLGAVQLNATASVPGTFTYAPGAGTVLPLGDGQSLEVLFVPDQAGLYENVVANVLINIVNAVPVAATDTLDRADTTRTAKILLSALAGNDSDADGDPLTVIAVGDAQPPGATVILAGAFALYTAPTTTSGHGSFTYTLSDGPGGHTVTGLVTVNETSPASTSGPNHAVIAVVADDIVVTFLGVPGRTYRVQFRELPGDWQDATPAIHTAAPNGVFAHTDENPNAPMRLYRAVGNP